jgi:hypothetical protein
LSESRLDTSLFRLPDGVDVEVVLVRLEDGRIVARTAEELPPPERKETPATSPAPGKP